VPDGSAAPDPAPASAPPGAAAPPQTIRVAVEVLEELMVLVSELVLTRNQPMQPARARGDSALTVPLQRLSHITSDLQEGVMKTRIRGRERVSDGYCLRCCEAFRFNALPNPQGGSGCQCAFFLRSKPCSTVRAWSGSPRRTSPGMPCAPAS
jgi:hypothetical protein